MEKVSGQVALSAAAVFVVTGSQQKKRQGKAPGAVKAEVLRPGEKEGRALATFTALLVPVLRTITAGGLAQAHAVENLVLLAWLALTVFVLWFFRRIEPRIFMLTLALAGIVTVVTTALIRFLFIDGDGGEPAVFLLALLLLCQIVVVTAWLRKVMKETETS